jgi:chemotaxis protein methyltransferase CheR
MTRSISDELISQAAELIAAQLGLHFPPARWDDLERGIGAAARELGSRDLQSFVRSFISSPWTKSRIEILASHLTIGETYFFRDGRTFEILQEHILPELISSRQKTERRLGVWSAGCCTGEEPYSIAMLLSRMIPDLTSWNITILGTDINRRFLQRASEGIYRDWSFRSNPTWIQAKDFHRKNGLLEISPDVKKMVTLSYLNLAEDAFPSLSNNTNAMDLILCRNVLMYFSVEQARKVIGNFHRCLIDGGWLIVSPSETSQLLFSQFQTVSFPEATLYQKSRHEIRAAGRLPYSSNQETPSLSWLPTIPAQPDLDSSALLPRGELPPPATQESGKPDAQSSPYEEALMLYQQGSYTEAADKLLLFLSQEGEEQPKAAALLARVYANQGKLGEALQWCEKSIAADKLDAACHYLHAVILQEQGSIKEAALSLNRALYLDHRFVLAHFALGNLTSRQGKLKESQKHFENALSLLSAYQQGEVLPESEGIAAGRLAEIIQSTTNREISR